MLFRSLGLYFFWIEINKTRTYKLGEINVKGISDYTVYFEQVNEPFEPISAVHANILYKDKGVDGFIFGTHDSDRRDALDFKAKCTDSIIYILFTDSTMLDYYDLKKRNIPFDSIHSYLLRNDKEIKRIR